MAVGNKIFELRKAAGLSQEQVAEKLSVSRQTISKWESGSSAPDISNVIAISKLFDVSTDYLLSEEAAKEQPEYQSKETPVETTMLDSTDDENETAQVQKPIRSRRRVAIRVIAVIAILALAFFAYKYLAGKKADVSKLSSSVLFLELYDDYDNVIGTASGVPIDANTVVTNYHVIDGTYKIVAYNSEETAESEIKSVLSYDETADLAILHCEECLSVKPLSLGNSDDVKQGDTVFAVGYPLGLSNTISDGIVSSRYKDENNIEIIQITAPISPGSSGGALFNENGKVVGIVCASYENGQNLNLVIPSKAILPLLDNQDAIELSTHYNKTLSGYAALNSYKHIDFEELCNNPSQYDGKNITVTGYIAMRSIIPDNIGEISTEPTRIFIVPSTEYLTQWESFGGYITSKDILLHGRELRFTDFEILKILECSGSLYVKPNTMDDSLNAIPGDYVAITGIFHYRQAEKSSSDDGTVSNTDYSYAYMDLTDITIINP